MTIHQTLAALRAKCEKRDAIGRRYQRKMAAKTRRLESEFAETFVKGSQWYQRPRKAA